MLTRPRLALLLLIASTAAAQNARRPLTHKDYDGWRSIQNPQLSRDGKYLAYGLFPQEGDGEVVVREIASGREFRENAGALPAPPPRAVDEPEPPPQRLRLLFTSDSRYLAAGTYPSKAETDKAKKEKKKPEEMPKGGLVIFDLASGAATRIEGVRSFQSPAKGGAWLAYLKAGKPAPEDKKKEPRREYGTEMVLRDLARGEERSFAGVLEVAFARDGKTLVYAVASRNEEENGVFAVTPGSAGAPLALMKGKGKYSKLAWDREGAQLAFIAEGRLCHWDRRSPAAAELVTASTLGMPKGYAASEHGAVTFSRGGERVFFGSAEPRKPAEENAAPADDRVVADLWHWLDDFIQPIQKVRAARERNASFMGVFHLKGRTFVQLANADMRRVRPSDDGRFALGSDDHLYRRMGDYDAPYADQYVIDTLTGARRKAVEAYRGFGDTFDWSPDGRYVLFYRDRNWHTIAVPEGAVTNITSGLGVNFWNERDDRPEPPWNHGAAGWTRDGRFVIVYDRHDVWQISPDGKTARNLTDGVGRRENLQFRVVRVEREDDPEMPRGLDPEKPLLLRAENLATRESGFWRDRINAGAPPERLIMGPRNYRALQKAAEADVVLVTASSFYDYPDLHVSDARFRDLRRVTDANPQKAGLLWGRGELVSYRNADGVPLQAALYKPENFDPAKKYPLMVYIYERLSQNLHNFVDPRPGHSINFSYYVSNGYLVLTPDIVYTVGSPGQSALKCVLPAIQAVVDKGIVDENAIGIQGHSWGGYQIAYMVGHTRRFRAAEAGAPVGNMISAYNGIRWGSGMPRQFQYERSQSRIGGSLWENPLQFIENSPIFHADRVATPLLILHDDQDDAVPWYQGIELFLSLRRLGKEAYLFNYNGEMHGLRRRPNQKDFTVRLQQFFDHFLKGAPKPEWMEKGIAYTERDRKFNP